MTTVAVIAEDEDDAISWATNNARRFPGARIVLLWWPEPFKRILQATTGFDRLIVTAAANKDPRINARGKPLPSRASGALTV